MEMLERWHRRLIEQRKGSTRCRLFTIIEEIILVWAFFLYWLMLVIGVGVVLTFSPSPRFVRHGYDTVDINLHVKGGEIEP